MEALAVGRVFDFDGIGHDDGLRDAFLLVGDGFFAAHFEFEGSGLREGVPVRFDAFDVFEGGVFFDEDEYSPLGTDERIVYAVFVAFFRIESVRVGERRSHYDRDSRGDGIGSRKGKERSDGKRRDDEEVREYQGDEVGLPKISRVEFDGNGLIFAPHPDADFGEYPFVKTFFFGDSGEGNARRRTDGEELYAASSHKTVDEVLRKYDLGNFVRRKRRVLGLNEIEGSFDGILSDRVARKRRLNERDERDDEERRRKNDKRKRADERPLFAREIGPGKFGVVFERVFLPVRNGVSVRIERRSSFRRILARCPGMVSLFERFDGFHEFQPVDEVAERDGIVRTFRTDLDVVDAENLRKEPLRIFDVGDAFHRDERIALVEESFGIEDRIFVEFVDALAQIEIGEDEPERENGEYRASDHGSGDDFFGSSRLGKGRKGEIGEKDVGSGL